MPPKHQWLLQIPKDWQLKWLLKTRRKARCERRGQGLEVLEVLEPQESPDAPKEQPDPVCVLPGRVDTSAGPTINLWTKVRVDSLEVPPISAGVWPLSAGFLKFFPCFMVSVLNSSVSLVRHFSKYFILFWCYGKWNFLNFFPDCSTNQFWLILLFRTFSTFPFLYASFHVQFLLFFYVLL